MFRLLRTIFGLFTVNVAILVLIIATRHSASTWGCITYDLYTRFIMLDVTHGIFFEDRTFVPDKYTDAVTRRAVPNTTWVYYDFTASPDLHRNGLVDSNRSIGYFDSDNKLGVYNSVYNISPDHRYIAIETQTAQGRVMTLHDSATFEQVASVAYESTLAPRDLFLSLGGIFTMEWSPSDAWFAFMHVKDGIWQLTLMSPQTHDSQTLTLVGADPSSPPAFVWSSSGTALAVLGGANDAYPTPVRLAMLALRDGRWQFIYSYDTGIKPYEPIPYGRLERFTWDSSGEIFSALRAINDVGYELLRFPVTPLGKRTAAKIQTKFKPVFVLDGDWLCVTDDSASYFVLSQVADLRLTYTLASNCTVQYLSPDNATLLAKQLTSADPAKAWVGFHASPFSQFSLPSAELPSTLETGQWTTWSPDTKMAFVFTPDQQTTNDDLDGFLTVINTTTEHWFKVQPTVVMNLAPVIAPDSSRFTVWNADRQHLLLMDTDNHIITEISFPVPITIPGTVVAQWSPDSQLLTTIYYASPSQALFTTYDRDGHQLAAFDQAIVQPAVMGLTTNQWSHCEPPPKFPDKNLPQ